MPQLDNTNRPRGQSLRLILFNKKGNTNRQTNIPVQKVVSSIYIALRDILTFQQREAQVQGHQIGIQLDKSEAFLYKFSVQFCFI